MYEQTHTERNLDEMLRNSFGAIKRDMEQLRAAQTAVTQALDDLRERSARLEDEDTGDKVEALQRRIKDLADDLQNLRKLEENLAVHRKDMANLQKTFRSDVASYEKRSQDETRQYRRSVDEDIRTLNKKLELHLTRFDEKLTEAVKLLDKRTADELLAVRKEIAKLSPLQKEHKEITEQLQLIRAQMSQLTQKGAQLFEERAKVYGERVAEHLQQVDRTVQSRLQGVDASVQSHLNAQSAQVNQQLNEQAKQINAQMANVKLALERSGGDQNAFTKHVQKQLDEKISRSLVEKLVEDINREFNTLKQLMVKDFKRVDDEFKKHGKFLREQKFKTSVTEIHDEFDRLKDRVNYIDTSKIAKGYFDQQMDELKAGLAKVQDELTVIKATAMSGRSRRNEVSTALRRMEAERSPARKRAYRGMAITSTILLLVSLTLVIVGAATHFTWGAVALYYTIGYLIVAVVTFAIGLILRIMVWKKRKAISPEEQLRLTEVETGEAPF